MAANKSNNQLPNGPRASGLQPSSWFFLILAVAVVAFSISLGKQSRKSPDVPQTATPPETPEVVWESSSLDHVDNAVVTPGPAVVVARPVPQSSPSVSAPMIEPSPAARALVGGVLNLQSAEGVVTDADVAAWKENLQQIVAHGLGSVPAIAEFLAKNTDLDFGPGGLRTLGYTSARTALIDALAQISGPEAQGALRSALKATADPREIALLTQALEKLDPGTHRSEALAAVRESLAMAKQGMLPDRDLAPLFEVLQRYGDASLVPELEQNAKSWGYYSIVALAQLPDNAGIPSVLQIATGPKWSSGARDAAWKMVAQVATQSPEAREALIEQVRQNKFSAFNWASTTTLLAGDQVHYRNSALDAFPDIRESSSTVTGQQRLYAAPTPETLTVERINQQLALIEELRSVTADPTALRALQQARGLALKRLSQASTASLTAQ